ncbi:MAG: ATP-binding protein [Woeseiaceae bacterium]|nr:ATP-binding protein [Woeseiaceae bacterium]
MNTERVSPHYVLRYVYAILLIVVIAVTTVLSTLYVAQQDERQTHERIDFYHLQSVSQSHELRREVASLRQIVVQALTPHPRPTAGPAGVNTVQISPAGLLQAFRSRVEALSTLQQQYNEPVFPQILQHMQSGLNAIDSELRRDDGPTEATLNKVDVLAATVEQFDRLHQIESHRELEALAKRQGDRPRFLAVLLACLAFSVLAVVYLVRSLRVSMDRQYDTELALTESQERLHHSQKLDALGRLIGGVAHDFNNLLTVILGHTEILRLAKSDDRTVDEGLVEVQRAGQQAASLTQQLLAFSRRQQLQPRVLDLNEQIRGLASLLERIVSKDVRLKFTYAKEVCAIEVDPDQLRQVILNLIANARDAMPDGGELRISTDSISVSGAGSKVADLPDGHYGRLIVADTGIGMNENTMQRIFEPFFTTKEESRGTGLGLSTVHGVVTSSGGHIRVDSVVGQGTKFFVYFPLTDKRLHAESAVGGDVELPRGAETILIVEDDESVLEFVKRGLSSLGYSVETATGGASGLDVCARDPGAIDLILSDVVMPEMNGTEFMKQALKLCPGATPIFMSAYTQDEVLRAGQAGGDIPLLNKPFKLDELARLVRELLDNRAAVKGAAAG